MNARAPLRLLGIMTCLMLLSGCGFAPIYGTHSDANSPVADKLNDVAIAGIPDRPGQMLRNDLIDLMYIKGRPHNPKYHLTVGLHSTEEDLGILADATSTRTLMNMYADYSLTDSKGKVVDQGTAHSVASFNKLSQQFGTQSAREGAIERTVNEVGNQIVSRISLYFTEKEGKETPHETLFETTPPDVPMVTEAPPTNGVPAIPLGH